MDILSKFKETLSFDLRSLALFRISLGLVLFFDLFFRLKDLKAHYTDWGILPRYALLEKFSNPLFFSLHNINGLWQFQLILFLIAMVAAICLIVGFRTKIAVVVSWILLISLQNHNHMILQGGDVYLRVILFWAMFLPLGKIWSLDSKKVSSEKRIFSIGSVGLLFQIMMLYVFAGLLKNHPIWYSEGSAAYYALSLEQFRTIFGNIIYAHIDIMQFFTFAVLAWELMAPFLLLTPILFGPIRTFVVFGFFALHASFGISMLLGHFPWVAFTAFSVLLPTWFWDKLKIGYEIKILNKLDRFKKYSGNPNINENKLLVIIGIIFIILSFSWNLQTLGKINVPYSLEVPLLLTRMDQQWNMFAPFPLKEDGWYVIPGKLTSGKEIDVYRESAVNWEKPRYATDFYENERWRKYMMNLWSRDNAAYRLYYGQYLCRNWNDKNADKLMTFNITYVKEESLLNYNTKPLERVVIWQHNCFG